MTGPYRHRDSGGVQDDPGLSHPSTQHIAGRPENKEAVAGSNGRVIAGVATLPDPDARCVEDLPGPGDACSVDVVPGGIIAPVGPDYEAAGSAMGDGGQHLVTGRL